MKQLTVKEAVQQEIISIAERTENDGTKTIFLTDLSDGSEFLQEEKIEGKPAFFRVFLVIDKKEFPEGTMKYVHSVIM